MSDITVWKSQMSEKMLTCTLIYASRRPLIVESPALPTRPNPRYVSTKFERRQQLYADDRNLWPSTRQLQPTRRDATGRIQIAFDRRTYKFMLIYATTITHCQIQHSRCTKYLFKTLAKHRSNFTPVLEVSTHQRPTARSEQRHTVCRIDIVKYGSFGGLTY